MPVYEYACEKCGKTTEELRRMSDADAPATCEHCGSRSTQRAHSVFATASKGESSLPMASSGGGGCCPCGKSAGACGSR